MMFGQFKPSFLWSKGTIDHALGCIFESVSLALKSEHGGTLALKSVSFAMDFCSLPTHISLNHYT